MKVIKPSAKGLNHSGHPGMTDNHLQKGHKPLGSAQMKAIAAKASKPKPDTDDAMPSSAPDADDVQGY